MNELILIDKIEKKLQEKREPIIFPLTPSHRKELRQLRDKNIGNLRNRLNIIKKLKCEEYQKKYFSKIQKELKKYDEIVEKLNNNWNIIINNIDNILKERKKYEDKLGTLYLDLKSDWNDLSNLKDLKGVKRIFSLDKNKKSLEIAKDEFNKKYGSKFLMVEKEIEKIIISYEEAINFGDLEIVKRLYYMMKNADKLFIKIDGLKV